MLKYGWFSHNLRLIIIVYLRCQIFIACCCHLLFLFKDVLVLFELRGRRLVALQMLKVLHIHFLIHLLLLWNLDLFPPERVWRAWFLSRWDLIPWLYGWLLKTHPSLVEIDSFFTLFSFVISCRSKRHFISDSCCSGLRSILTTSPQMSAILGRLTRRLRCDLHFRLVSQKWI